MVDIIINNHKPDTYLQFIKDDFLRDNWEFYVKQIKEILKIDGLSSDIVKTTQTIPHLIVDDVINSIDVNGGADYHVNKSMEINYCFQGIYEIGTTCTIYDVLGPMDSDVFTYPSCMSKTDMFVLKSIASIIHEEYSPYDLIKAICSNDGVDDGTEMTEFININKEQKPIVTYSRHIDKRLEFIKNHKSNNNLITNIINVFLSMIKETNLMKLQYVNEYNLDENCIDGFMFFDFVHFGDQKEEFVINMIVSSFYELNEDMNYVYITNEHSYQLKEYIETHSNISDFHTGHNYFYEVFNLYKKFVKSWNLLSYYVKENYQLKLEL